MKVLIDTHIWGHMADRPERLGKRTHRLLSSTRTEIWLSSLSIYEVYQIARKGKWRLKGDTRTWIEKSLKALPFFEAPVTHAIALEAGTFELYTGDPIDRLIVATARAMKIPLVTEDEAIIRSRCVEVIPND